MILTPSQIRSLPKVELHVHLDGSLSFDFVRNMYPQLSYERWKSVFCAPKKCRDLPHFLSYAQAQISLLQTEQHLRLAVKDVLKQELQDNVIYSELRFAPHLHTLGGLSAFEVTTIVSDELKKWETVFGTTSRLILCTLRDSPLAISEEVAELCIAFKDSNVVAMDIAGDENAYPFEFHVPAFRKVAAAGMGITAHAGEEGSFKNVLSVIDQHFPVHRIGHGVRMVDHPDFQSVLTSKEVHLEICPTSNVQTNVFSVMNDHPLDEFYEAGIRFSINTDDRTICGTTLSEEYEKLVHTFGWTKNHFLRTNLNALEAAWVDETTKETLKSTLCSGYEGIN